MPESERELLSDVNSDAEETTEASQSASTSRKTTPKKRPSTTMLLPKRINCLKRNTKSSSTFEDTVNKLQQIAELANTDTEDQYDKFAVHLASQLRELPLRSFIVLQSKIQNLITEERLTALYESQTLPQSVVNISHPNSTLGSESVYSESEITYVGSLDLCYTGEEAPNNV